eukprot:gene284-9934_t
MDKAIEEQINAVTTHDTPRSIEVNQKSPESSRTFLENFSPKPFIKNKPQLPKKPAFLFKSNISNQGSSPGQNERYASQFENTRHEETDKKTSLNCKDAGFSSKGENGDKIDYGNLSSYKDTTEGRIFPILGRNGKGSNGIYGLNTESSNVFDDVVTKSEMEDMEKDLNYTDKEVCVSQQVGNAMSDSSVSMQDSKLLTDNFDFVQEDVFNCFEDITKNPDQKFSCDKEKEFPLSGISQRDEILLAYDRTYENASDQKNTNCRNSVAVNNKQEKGTILKPRPSRPPPPPPQRQKYQQLSDINLDEKSNALNLLDDFSEQKIFGFNQKTTNYGKEDKLLENNVKCETVTCDKDGVQEKEPSKECIDKKTIGKVDDEILTMKDKNDEQGKIGPVGESLNLPHLDGKHFESVCSRISGQGAVPTSPVMKRENRVAIKNKKENRKSCPPPDTTTVEAKEEIKETVLNKWKYRSFAVDSQNKRQNSSKPELLQRLQEQRKKSEEKGHESATTFSKPKSLPAIKDDVDEEMEDAVFFDYVLVVKLRNSENGLEPYISFRFPPKVGIESLMDDDLQKYDKEIDERVASIPQFCFPDLKAGMRADNYLEHHVGFASSETFSFVLTDMMGQRLFGYCRQIQVKERSREKSSAALLPEVYCIVSPYGLFGLYSQILDEVEQQCAFSSSHVFVFLKAGGTIQVSFYSGDSVGLKSLKLKREADSSIHEHVDLSLLFERLPVSVILSTLSALMLERRIILASTQLSLLSACCHGFVSLLYPFIWQHTYIPVLPCTLVDMCCLPTPYLLGVLSGCLPEIEDLPIDEAIIVNLDQKRILRNTDMDSKCSLPSQIENQIESGLDRNMSMKMSFQRVLGGWG